MVRQTIKLKSDVLTFGKYKGKTIQEVMNKEASYLTWLDEQEIVDFDEDLFEDIVEKEAEQRGDYLRDNYDTALDDF